jgi:hypothetical protein
MTIFLLLAAHQGEEFVIILPAVMLVGAFFIMRWANQNDGAAADAPEAEPEADLPEEAAVGAGPSPGRRDGDETTR